MIDFDVSSLDISYLSRLLRCTFLLCIIPTNVRYYRHRVRKGKRPLAWNNDLVDVAAEHANDMRWGRVQLGSKGAKERFRRYAC